LIDSTSTGSSLTDSFAVKKLFKLWEFRKLEEASMEARRLEEAFEEVVELEVAYEEVLKLSSWEPRDCWTSP
jgi:hypothetical protein